MLFNSLALLALFLPHGGVGTVTELEGSVLILTRAHYPAPLDVPPSGSEGIESSSFLPLIFLCSGCLTGQME